MPATNSNAIATLNLADQDQLTTGFPSTVSRTNVTVTFPSTNGTFYSGYFLATASFSNTLFSGLSVPFVYIRNCNTSGNAQLDLNITGATGGTAAVYLNNQGFFLFANPTNAVATGSPTVNTLLYSAQGGNVVVEYFYSY